MGLVEFYHEVQRFLWQKDVEADKKEVNALYSGGRLGAGSNKAKGKRKSNNGYDGSVKEGIEVFTYKDLNKILERIYLDTGGNSPTESRQGKNPQRVRGYMESTAYSISWMGITETVQRDYRFDYRSRRP